MPDGRVGIRRQLLQRACAKPPGTGRFLEEIPVVPFNGSAARAYGPARLATRERKRDALDKLIAAHALALNVTLVTNNEADFTGFPGLRVDNWVASH